MDDQDRLGDQTHITRLTMLGDWPWPPRPALQACRESSGQGVASLSRVRRVALSDPLKVLLIVGIACVKRDKGAVRKAFDGAGVAAHIVAKLIAHNSEEAVKSKSTAMPPAPVAVVKTPNEDSPTCSVVSPEQFAKLVFEKTRVGAALIFDL